jgi:predicted RNase H-like nuclease (RuvC/YqgF family)
MTNTLNETRLDRIERNLEVFFTGMLELKESQKKTGEQIMELKESQKKTGEQIMELKESQKKTDEQIMELKESQKRTDEQLNRTDEQLNRTDAQLNRTDAQLNRTDAQLQKTIKKLDDIGDQLGDMGLVQGEVAEELFYRNVTGLFLPMDMRFARIRRNVKVKGFGEYDIVADDEGRVLVIEVKNKLSKRLVDEFMQKKLPRFKTLLPEYRESKVLAGIGALVVKDDVGRYAEKAGLFVLTQSSDGGATLFNREGFRPKEFGG